MRSVWPVLLLLCALALPARAQDDGWDAADSLVTNAYDAVMEGLAFRYRFDATLVDPDTTIAWGGHVTTYAEPPDGAFRYRIEYDDREVDAEALGPDAYYVRMPRTRRVYVDSTFVAVDEDQVDLLTRMHPTLTLMLSNVLSRAHAVTGPTSGESDGRPCEEVTFVLRPPPGSPSVRVCFDRGSRMPSRVTFLFGPPGMSLTTRYSPAEAIAVPPPETFALAPLPPGYAYAPYDGASEPRLAVGEPVPEFELAAPDGSPVRLSDLRGQTVLLDFWGSWCSPCVAALPAVEAMSDAHPRLRVLGLASYENPGDDPVAFARARGASYPILLATDDVLERFRVSVFPTYYVIGPDGTLLFEGIHDDEDEVPVEDRLGTFLSTLDTLTDGF